MRKCPSCQHELEQLAIVQGKCPHCGAILRKRPQHMFGEKRPADDDDNLSEEDVNEFNLDEYFELGPTDTDPGSQTIEIGGVSGRDEQPAVDPDDITPLDSENILADAKADGPPSDPSDAFILGESIDLEVIGDDSMGRTIDISDVVVDVDGMTPLEGEREPVDQMGQPSIDYISDASLDLNLSNAKPAAPRSEGSGAAKEQADEEPLVDADDVTPLEDESTEGRKPATIEYTSDQTMEFQSFSGATGLGAAPSLNPKQNRRSTHAGESDKTIDLSASADDENQVDSQWRGTIDQGARQGQTIRQRETITGYRSSLPVKSRYVREKRTEPVAVPKTLSEVPDYELLDIIGEGGMGVVYAAHQSSIARTVAVKMLKKSPKIREEQRDKFISEAVVTGELDHPNIVPIYDLGSNDEGALFYSMKRVRGTPWDKVIQQKSLDENLSILMRVADAVAFAHAGGVIHRDLKPENVMLGDFGEVLVMDWGLARITSEFAHVDAVYQSDSLGGTPAYMSPEMAKGPVEAINKTSDVYLLGAILYEIIGGQPPHSGRDVMQCLLAASQNRIDPIRYDGELKGIALRAMATQQEDRYQSVKEMQEAIRVYQSHSESLVLTAHANQNLQKARTSKDYQLYARSLYGFQEALALWERNHRARSLLKEAQRDYATYALEKGDLDLAASLLDSTTNEHEALRAQIEQARQERDARQRRLKLAKMAVAALAAGIILISSVGYVIVRGQRNRAVVAEKEAVTQKNVAVTAQKGEEEARIQAEKDRDAAKLAKDKEEKAHAEAEKKRVAAEIAQKNESIARQDEAKQRAAAELAKEREEYEAYIAQIGLANAKINDNAYDYASQLLDESKRELRNWEWGRLEHLCHLAAANYKVGAPVAAVAYSPDGKSFATGGQDGKVTVRDAQTGKVRFQAPHGQYVLSVDYSPSGKQIASGSSDGTIQILNAETGEPIGPPLSGHQDGVLSVRFSPNGQQLLSSSYDNTARLWDLATRATLQKFHGHSWWVWAAEFSPDANRIVTAGQDGKAIVWEKWEAMQDRLTTLGKASAAELAQPTPESPIYGQFTTFPGHTGAVYSARFSPDGKLVATGGYDKVVMLWNPDEVTPVDIGLRLDHKPEAPPNAIRLIGHDGPVRSVGFAPKGQLVLSSSEDNTIRVWDPSSRKAITALRGHGRAVRAATFSPDGHWVLSGSDDEHIRVWDVQGYRETRVLHATVFSGHEDAVLSARYSHDGRQIITASRDRTASLWDTASGKPLKRFAEGHEFLVSGAVFLPDQKHLATGAGDNSVRIWNITAGTQQAVLTPTGRIGTLAASKDGKWIATGSPGTDLKLWNAATGEIHSTLSGHEAEVTALAFSPTSDQLASGDNRGHIRLWRKAADTDHWEVDLELVGHNGSISAIKFTPDGKRLVSSSGDHSCAQWDLTTGTENRELVLKHPEYVSSLDLSTDGALALTTCDDGYARLWRLADAKQLAAVKSPGQPYNFVAFSPDGSTALLTASADRQVSLWNLSAEADATGSDQTASSPRPLLDFNELGGEVWAAMYDPDGQHILTVGGSEAQLWDLQSRKLMVHYSPHGAVASAAVSNDGKLIATGSWDHSAKIWDAHTGHAIRKLEGGHTGFINSVEFSADGRELLTASDDGSALIWDVATGKLAGAPFRGHADRLLGATYSPNGQLVLTVSSDKTGQIWDHATRKALRTLTGHDWAVLCGQFSADSKRVITGSDDATARIWDVETGKQLLKLEGHTAAVSAVAFSPDGTRVLTGSRDNTAKLWDATTGKEILSLPGHTQEVTSVSFSPDGKNVLTSSRDGTAIIWLARDWHPVVAKVVGK